MFSLLIDSEILKKEFLKCGGLEYQTLFETVPNQHINGGALTGKVSIILQ